jgi:hypothetical protein
MTELQQRLLGLARLALALVSVPLPLDGARVALSTDSHGDLNVHGLSTAQLAAVPRFFPDAQREEGLSLTWWTVPIAGAHLCFFADTELSWDELDRHERLTGNPIASRKAPDNDAA